MDSPSKTMIGNESPVASAAMVAAFPALPAATAADEALLDAPELVGVLTRDDCDALGLMAEVTLVKSWSRRLPNH